MLIIFILERVYVKCSILILIILMIGRKYFLGALIEFQKKFYIELDSLVIDNEKEARHIKGRKALYQAKCPICQDIMSFNKGSKSINKNPYFFI